MNDKQWEKYLREHPKFRRWHEKQLATRRRNKRKKGTVHYTRNEFGEDYFEVRRPGYKTQRYRSRRAAEGHTHRKKRRKSSGIFGGLF